MRDQVIVTFVVSHACPLKCNFCCSTRDVVGPRRIRQSMMEDVMTRFAGEPGVARFSFTGGEPFLYLPDIKAAIRTVRAAGVTQPVHIMTSSHWARDIDQVRETLTELHGLGLDLLGLSYDHEHAKWVSPAQIEMVCDVAAELGIKVHLVGTFWNETDRLTDLIPELVARPEIRTFTYPVAEMGRAKESATGPRRRDVPKEDKYSCGRGGTYSLSVYPDGEVYPCCAGGLQIEGKLSCGNVNRDQPARIIYTALTKFHVRMVKEYGWGVLYALVEREAPELVPQLPRFEEADGVCTICRDLNLTLGEKLAPIYDLIEKEYARARAEHEWRDRIASDGWTEQRLVGDRIMSRAELLDRIVGDRDTRLDYLAGVLEIGAASKSVPVEPSLAAC